MPDIRNKIEEKHQELHISYRDEKLIPTLLQSYIKEQAKASLYVWCEELCARIGKSVVPITLRDTKSRWGSCSLRGINLSWRLAMLPADIAYYVCAHEVAHLIHANHGKDFWSLVGELCPHYGILRKELKTKGLAVLRYHFS